MKHRSMVIIILFMSYFFFSFIPIFASSNDQVYDSITFGINATVTNIKPDRVIYDNIFFGINCSVTEEGYVVTSPSTYWEIYHLSNRYDVNNDGYVLASDANIVWNNKEPATYNYLYDMNNDGYVLASDANIVWNNKG